MTQSNVSVLWCSPSYGYHGDLMYFRPILDGFVQRFPNTTIPVDETFPVENYPELPLSPILTFRTTAGGRHGDRHGRSYVSTRRVPSIGTILRLARVRADVYVLLEFTPIALTGFVLSKIRRARSLLLQEGHPRYRGAADSRIQAMIKRFVARHVDQMLVSNEEGRQYLEGLVGGETTRITTAPFLTSCPPSQVSARPSLSDASADGEVSFLFVGKLEEGKGLFQLVAALADLDRAGTRRWTLRIVGSGSALGDLRRQLAEYHLDDKVQLLGPASYGEVWPHYRGADVVVAPSLADYRSLVAFEAVNAGKPAVLSVHDGAAEELRRSGAAVEVVDPEDRAALVAALGRYMEDPDHLRQAREAAQNIPAEFSVAAIVENLKTGVLRALER